MVRRALADIEAGRLEKVVHARAATFDFDQPLDPVAVLQHLQPATPNCFHYGIRPEGGGMFFGASPERLFYVRDQTVESEAVAGTRARGASQQADAALRTELLESEKDRREHAFVQDAIAERLQTLCTSVEAPEAAEEMRLARGRHLRSRLRGTLRAGTSAVDLLRALHPTPAVGGVPAEAAQATIRAREPFDRGWYAGPVGWIGPSDAEFAVAIRSGLAHDTRLMLYSGAGIVAGSDPASEWDEIEQKIGDIAAVIGLDV
jgi:menaquinone-specific isochorismate synthase